MAALANPQQPKQVGDLLILPGYSFAVQTNKYGDEEVLHPQLVTRYYAGSWKNDVGGEKA